ncbi:MAG: NfeD family protein [Candidatus Syntrophosphaera sp.]|jgi:membrane protein implicated in regulation of membrane protease activity
MFTIEPWHIWIVLGIIFVIVEILDPAFFFIALGIGAIITGLLSLINFIDASIPLQILIFALISFITFLFTRKFGRKILKHAGGETNVFALKGKTGFITQTVPAEGRGRVKIGGEEWVAVSEDDTQIKIETKVVVKDIDGNKLVVAKTE